MTILFWFEMFLMRHVFSHWSSLIDKILLHGYITTPWAVAHSHITLAILWSYAVCWRPFWPLPKRTWFLVNLNSLLASQLGLATWRYQHIYLLVEAHSRVVTDEGIGLLAGGECDSHSVFSRISLRQVDNSSLPRSTKRQLARASARG